MSRDKIDTIDSSIDRISSFIYKLLGLYRTESKDDLSKVKIGLSSLVGDLVKLFTITTLDRGIILSSSIKENVYIDGNREEINELISNIISNSIKYIGNGDKKEIKINLSINNNYAVITISDTGIGINEDEMPNLFEKFYRIKNDETKGIKGTGLGLAICKKIIESHGGEINVVSKFGEGTVFTLKIPLTKNI